MPISTARALALTTALGAATLLGAHAIAQTTSPAQPPSAPAQPAPDAGPRGPGMGPGMGPGRMGEGRMGEGRMGRGDGERGWRSEGGYGPRGGGQGWGGGEGRGRMAQLSDIDRQAMLSARLAASKAALLLTPEQEKLWPPVESAIRDGMKLRQDWRARIEKEGVAANPVERMKRMGEMASARGAAMTKLADAAAPLYASLTDDQKRRLRMVRAMGAGMGGGMGGGMGLGMMGGEGPRMGMGPGMREDRGGGDGMRGRHHDHHGHGYRHGYEGRGERRL
jgi:zinc resistance-associated protein